MRTLPISRRIAGIYFLLTLLTASPLWADDTEIFFSPVSRVESQPNIILLLDASHSMLNYDCLNGSSQWEHGPCDDDSHNGNTTRQERMNDALSQVINTITDVNIGIMRFSNTYVGGRVIYPVRNIEEGNVRQELIDTLYNDMEVQLRTPTVGGMIEATRYFAGQDVLYGKRRWYGGLRRTGLYAELENGRYSRVSHPDSYTGGTLVQPGECSDANLSHEDCADEQITGNPVYDSPITNECQSNHLILVTDGLPQGDNTTRSHAKALVGNNCPDYSGAEQCATEIADYLYSTDLRPDIDGVQTVTTHTIGFNINSQWLKDIATGTRIVDDAVEPGYYEAESAEELVDAFTNIIDNVESENSTFVAPAVSVDRFTGLTHRNELYLSLFKPSTTAAWAGNLKRYDLKGNPAVLYDANDPQQPAIDPDTGLFNEVSKSFRSDSVDGRDGTRGGAASKLRHQNRKVVTYSGTDQTNLFHANNELSIDNATLKYAQISERTNVATSGVATQSTTSYRGVARRAIDGTTRSTWSGGSVTHTTGGLVQPWWQVTLPEAVTIEDITIYGRTDSCCMHRLSDVHVFISETPFGNASLDDLLSDSTLWHRFLPGQASAVTNIPVLADGKYVRIQLASNENQEALSLAEVEVYSGNPERELQEKTDMLAWARGQDVKDADEDGDTTESRYYMGDPLHTSPVTVTYGGSADAPESLIFLGTNQGFLHAIDTSDGTEAFAFMPEALIENLEDLYSDDYSDSKVDGLDGGLTTWIDDQNSDGVISSDAGDHAYLYAGMRRGGASYYALNVSDKDAPQYMWQIDGGSAGFEELGETWSDMVPTTIKYNGAMKKVLIFGGGYDNSQDEKDTRSPDSVGRALYIVDATTGALLWSGGAGDHNETKIFQDMTYSLPATPATLDIDGDGAVDHIYIGDMGGRIWRFDFNDTLSKVDISGGIIADLASDNVYADTRRFYHTPDISLSLVDGKLMTNIAIGSGYQAHPLNTIVDDRFYLIRLAPESYISGNYGIPERLPDGSTGAYHVITEDDLYDATDNLIADGTTEEVGIARQKLSNSAGWMIKMEINGEKILGSSVTFDETVMFTSYRPSDITDVCAPAIGSGAFWLVNLDDATPVENYDETDSELTKTDRSAAIPGEGLPPPPTILIVETDGADDGSGSEEMQVVTFSGANQVEEHDMEALLQRVFWSEYPNF